MATCPPSKVSTAIKTCQDSTQFL